MSGKKLTPWFDDDVKPVHVGLYEVHDSQLGFSLWDGKVWKTRFTNMEDAARAVGVAFSQDKRWRGLARRPR